MFYIIAIRPHGSAISPVATENAQQHYKQQKE